MDPTSPRLSRVTRKLGIALLGAGVILGTGSCSFSEPAPLGDPLTDVEAGCDPLVPQRCGYPFPNDFWRTVDANGRGTLHLEPVLPKPVSGTPIDPRLFAGLDGFSTGEEAIAFFPNVSAAGLSNEDHIEETLHPSSRTLLVDADTGKLVPHFAELDEATFKPDDKALIIRPAVRLLDGHRYVVGVRGLQSLDGTATEPSRAFRLYRDRIATTSAAFEARRPHMDSVLDTLERVGVARSDLILAWDYTTGSKESVTSDLLAMRDDALAFVGTDGPEYRITAIDKDPNPDLAMRLTGMMTVPLYLDKPGPGGAIVRDEAGRPRRNGTAEFEFIVLVPKTATSTNRAAILQNGHGLLGSKSEGANGYFAKMCNRFNYVGVAVDWVGMANEDKVIVTEAAASNVNVFRLAVDRQHQGILNSLLAMRMMKGRMTRDPNLVQDGVSIVDPTRSYYRGDSQGGIFGTTYMALSTDVTRGLVGEPGMAYSLMLDRSVDFAGFKFLLRGQFPNGLDARLIQAFVQMEWDRTEPNGYAPYLARDMLPNTPAHRLLLHVAIGDHQVTPLAAHLIARTVGAKNLAPTNRPVFGIPEAVGPLEGESALVEFDFGLPPAPKQNLPMREGKDPHDDVRGLAESMDQTDEFFRTGKVRSFCDGSCDPH